MRIWVKKEASRKNKELVPPPEDRLFPRVSVKEWGIEVEYHRGSGRWYVDYDEDLSLPPDIPPDLIELVSLSENIERGLRRQGVYRHEGAELVAKTRTRVISGGSFEEDTSTTQQEVSVTGPSIAAVKSIYTLFRQGKLQPAEDWEAEQPVSKVEVAKSSAEGD